MTTLAAMFNPADKSTPGHYDASQTALLLLDFHTMFVQMAGGLDASAASKAAAQMRHWAKSQGMQVLHCLIDTDAAPFPTCKDAQRLASVVASMKSNGGDDEAAELLEGTDDNDVTFTRKPGHVSALKSPGLEEFLQRKGITSLVLAGLSTSGCVLRTALAACDAEYVVSVISDGCADPDQSVHDVMVRDVLSSRGWVSTAAEFQQGFAKAADGG